MIVTSFLFCIFFVLCIPRIVSKDLHNSFHHVDIPSNDTEVQSLSSFPTEIPYFSDRFNPWLEHPVFGYHDKIFYDKILCENCECHSTESLDYSRIGPKCFEMIIESRTGRITNLSMLYVHEDPRDILKIDEYIPCHRWDIICQFSDFTGCYQSDIYIRLFAYFFYSNFFHIP